MKPLSTYLSIKKSVLFLFLMGIGAFMSLFAQAADSSNAYRFLVGGHLYGSGYNQVSTFPSSSLYANVDRIKDTEAAFFMGLGDLVREGRNPAHWKTFTALTDQFGFPFYNAPGNHDLLGRDLYAQYLGKTFFHFYRGKDVFLILDTEAMIYPVDSLDQRAYFETVLSTLKQQPDIRNVFVFSHRLIWALAQPEFALVDQQSNMSWQKQPAIPFLDFWMPEIEGLAQTHPVWWFSGDVGTPWSFPLFYETDPDLPNLHYCATGIGNGQWDALVEVEVDSSGEVNLIPFPLCGQTLNPIESYDREYLKASFPATAEEKPNFWGGKVVPILKSKGFWAGGVLGILLCLGVWGLRRFQQKAKEKT